jgi:hypothetical protein
MTHDELVEKANYIFAAIKERVELCGKPHDNLNQSEEAEVHDHIKDLWAVLPIESVIGNADCFAIAMVLLRAIERQWAAPAQDTPPRRALKLVK